MYAYKLKDLPRVIALIITYNFYPHKNHLKLIVDTILIIYCIVNKILVNWGWFILYQMMIYTSDPPYASLICQFLDEILPHTLEKLEYEPGRAGYTINETTISRMGIIVTPKLKGKASSS